VRAALITFLCRHNQPVPLESKGRSGNETAQLAAATFVLEWIRIRRFLKLFNRDSASETRLFVERHDKENPREKEN
jgi:hypothetical protein